MNKLRMVRFEISLCFTQPKTLTRQEKRLLAQGRYTEVKS